MRFVHVRGHPSDEGNDRADALVQWGKKSRAYARLRERKEGEEEDIDIIKEGHIESDGTYVAPGEKWAHFKLPLSVPGG